jgi:hypothetical protein
MGGGQRKARKDKEERGNESGMRKKMTHFWAFSLWIYSTLCHFF